METRAQLRDAVFKVSATSFEQTALRVFQYQYQNNRVYHEFCELLRIDASLVQSIESIPFLPIDLYKTRVVITGNSPAEKIFTSSGTTGQQTSRHHVSDIGLYEESILRCFNLFFDAPGKYCFLALLPSYLERPDSSLVYMTEILMKQSAHPENGFFLYNHSELKDVLMALDEKGQSVFLFGVTFALLDFAEKFRLKLNHCCILETGGMKGRREEITREALHGKLKEAFSVRTIYSEYGMTELLSQAYLMDDGKFHCPPWMRVIIRDVNDPFQIIGDEMTGGMNVIDLANLDSCAFIATGDLGKRMKEGSFEVMGRIDYSDARGCNLMWEGV